MREPDDKEVSNLDLGYLPKISLSNEIATWKFIEEVIEKAMDKYSTSLQEDLEILK